MDAFVVCDTKKVYFKLGKVSKDGFRFGTPMRDDLAEKTAAFVGVHLTDGMRIVPGNQLPKDCREWSYENDYRGIS